MQNRFEPVDGNSPGQVGRSNSLASMGSASYLSRVSESNADSIPDLVSTDWSNDPEMQADESFEAAAEISRHFPQYKIPIKDTKNEHYVRMLCLLEFHQKVQFMVRHLKQYVYLLLRTWPREHDALYFYLCLDQIPPLIDLFRSLVSRMDETKTDQGYVGMAEAVLDWLTNDSEKNLKAWARHCQALSCTNMLDCVQKSVNDYARNHPNVLRLLQTKHNKFVLIEGLRQMRILYFNLPMIANKIVKDLEKKTKSYRDEAKIWQKIYHYLSSLPATIDNVCMPLVKKINRGQIHSLIDKKDSLFRQSDPTVKAYQSLLLMFPRTLFRFWVVAHVEVAVDKLTVTSASKVNHDYIRERTPMLFILLHDALLLLIKDGDRYVLRSFKSAREHASGGGTTNLTSTQSERLTSASASSMERHSVAYHGSFSGSPGFGGASFNLTAAAAAAANFRSNPPSSIPLPSGLVSNVANMAGAVLSDRPSSSTSSKIAPIFTLNEMHTSLGETIREEHLLNVVSLDPPILVRLLFSDEKELKRWSSLLKEHSKNSSSLLQRQKPRSNRPHTLQTKATIPESIGKGTESSELEQPDNISEIPEDTSSPIVAQSLEPTNDLDRVIDECNQLSQLLRATVCDALNLSDEEYATMGALLNAGGIQNLDQLLLAQFNLTEKWLTCLTHSVTLLFSQQQQRQQPNQSSQAMSSPSIASESDLSLAPKPPKTESSLGRNKSFGPGDSTNKKEVTKTSSTPNLTISEKPGADKLSVNVQQDSQKQQPLGVLNVHDHRRSRVKRSISDVISKVKVVPNPQVFSEAEQIASQMVSVMRRLHQISTESNAEIPDRGQATDSIPSSLSEESTNFGESDEVDDFETRERSDTLCPTKTEELQDVSANGQEQESDDHQDPAITQETGETLSAATPDGNRRDSVCLGPEEEQISDDNDQHEQEIAEDQSTPTANNAADEVDSQFSYEVNEPKAQPESACQDPDSQPPISSAVSIDRNDSQKSTSSSGFVEY